MTLIERISELATTIGAYIKSSILPRLLPSGGTTGQILRKTSATNYATEWADPAITGATINDATASTTQTYSSIKIEAVATSAANAAKDAILGGAGAAFDTLLELQQLSQGQDNAIAAMTTAIGNRVRFDATQTLNTAQKLQACTNIGIGDPDADLVAVFNAALV